MTPPNDPSGAPSGAKSHAFQSPRGTRDFYPIELAKRRWIEDKWRRTAVRHGFDEIDGPTFEHLDLYTVKSGEGIVNELFSFTRQGGDTRFALRPEFTPTLARLAAAKANALPKPTKWFSIGPYFRAERPQRGRLREFLQWNVDVIGDDSPEADAECIAACVGLLESVGFTPDEITIKINDRELTAAFAERAGVGSKQMEAFFSFVDGEQKRTAEANAEFISEHNLPRELVRSLNSVREEVREYVGKPIEQFEEHFGISSPARSQIDLFGKLCELGVQDWCEMMQQTIVRGLAYYTGTVFEVHETTGAERAIAGGGRYDNLIELFGGPRTPAVGFAMGDVVLSLVLQDKGLMPSDAQIAADLGLRPDVFVIPTEATEDLVKPLVARLRREGMHARHTYKSTRNVGKLLKEAGAAHARFALILESDSTCSVKNLDTNEQSGSFPTDEAIARITPPLT